MMLMVRFVFTLCLLFLLGFSFSRFYPRIAMIARQEKPVQLQFPPAPYPLHNKSFVIAVIGKNNGAYAEKTINSILSQNYDAFRVVYIDDGSTDGSASHARDTVFAHSAAQKVLFIQNEQSLGVIANLVRIAQDCFEDEILVVVDGENCLAHEWVLQKLNQYYTNPDLWMTFSKALELPSFTPLTTPPISSLAKIRSEPPSALYLKTFYATLFKKLHHHDLMYRGEFITEAIDFTYMTPLMEMAEGHMQYLPDTLYLVAKKEPKLTVNHAVFAQWIQEKPAYTPMAKLFSHPGECE